MSQVIDIPSQIDVTAPQNVQIVIREDRKVVWVNVDEFCRFRACLIGQLKVEDQSGLTEEEWRVIHNALSVYQAQQGDIESSEHAHRLRRKIQSVMDKVRDNHIK